MILGIRNVDHRSNNDGKEGLNHYTSDKLVH